MPFPSRRPQATLDRVLFLALAAVVLLAAFAGHDAPAVDKAGAAAILPDQPPAPAPVAVAADPIVNLPAGSAEIYATAAPAAVLTPPAAPKKWLPSGKGMWIYLPDKTEGGNVPAIIAKARATGLTHLWVRMGSAWDGFNVAPFMDKILPAAHAAGIKVIGWDFPKLDPMGPDIERAKAMINYRTPSGHTIDAFSPDIESPAEGTRLTPDNARRYGAALREVAGPDYTLIVTVPRPAKERPTHPYDEIVAGYDAIAPMIYWLDRQPDTDVAGALKFLSKYNVPVYPVGQAYDGSPEGGRKGVPPPDELWRFMRFAEKHGAAGVSFWSWQAANQPAWSAIREAVEFRAPAGAL
ncbi:MAG: hypothetical protein Q8K72_08750 [Acidimicrobiales bacterium]|nr:hypothetical protein [Acidimicrobiales bacterium]